MPLPELERSYEWIENAWYPTSGSGVTDRKRLAFALYSLLTGWTSNPWAIVASANTSSAGWPGPGWSSYLDVDYPESWFVAENVFGVQLCYWYDAASDATVYLSPDGSFSGGAVGSPPLTGANYSTLLNSGYSYWNSSSGLDCRVNAIHSTDGKFDIFLPLRTGSNKCEWCIAVNKFEDAASGWALPWLGYCNPANGTGYGWPRAEDGYGFNWQETENWQGFKASGGDSPFSAVIGCDVWDSYMAMENAISVNEISGRWQMFPLAAIGNTVGGYGVFGRLPDVYQVSSGFVTGDSIELDPTNPGYTWMVFGNYAFPWTGNPLLVTAE